MKYLFYIIIFLIIGELIFQIDYKLNIPQIKDVKNKINTNNYNNNNKIYLLGDSYTKGLGIQENERLANQIKISKYTLIDSSKSGDNWADYVCIYKNIASSLIEKDLIIIGVNWNDIAFQKGSIYQLLSNNLNKSAIKTSSLRKNVEIKGFRKKIHWLYNQSKMFNTLSGNFQNILKRKGIPLPIGDFEYFRNIGYIEKKDELIFGLKYIDSINLVHGSKTILYLMPDFNLTKRIEYFQSYINFFTINQFKTIKIINGPKNFLRAEDGYYCLSVQDGHPNGKAHIEMARQILFFIYKINY